MPSRLPVDGERVRDAELLTEPAGSSALRAHAASVSPLCSESTTSSASPITRRAAAPAIDVADGFGDVRLEMIADDEEPGGRDGVEVVF